MKTTLDLPDDLMRAVKIRAAESNRRLKDVVADALRSALGEPAVASHRRESGGSAPAAVAVPKLATADSAAAQRRLHFAALLSQLDQVPDLPQALEPLVWDDLGLPT
jgi:plasmid stability protein